MKGFEAFCSEVLKEPISRPWAMAYGSKPRNDEERAIFLQMYGKEWEPRRVHQRVFVKGRRAGGTLTAIKRMLYHIHCGDSQRHVGKGERIHAIIICQDRVTAREDLNYVERLYMNSILKSEVEDIQRDTILVRGGRAVSIRTCNARGALGISCDHGVLDEVGVWRTQGSDANIDRQVFQAITPSMVQFPDRELEILGTPWIPEGLLHEASTNPFSRSDRAVFHCPTALMVQGQSNAASILAELEIEKANDPENYEAAFNCQWLTNIDAFLPHGDITAAIRDWRERPPEPETNYVMAYDASSLIGRDRFVVGGGHLTEAGFTVDFLRGFDRQPVSQVCDEIKALHERYGSGPVLADQFGFAFLSELMRVRGVEVTQLPFTSRNKTEVFLDLKTGLAEGRFEVPNHPEAVRELRSLQSTRLSGGGYRISAPRSAHDDFACVLAILAHEATDGAGTELFLPEWVSYDPRDMPSKTMSQEDFFRAPKDDSHMWKKLS